MQISIFRYSDRVDLAMSFKTINQLSSMQIAYKVHKRRFDLWGPIATDPNHQHRLLMVDPALPRHLSKWTVLTIKKNPKISAIIYLRLFN